MQCDSIVTSEKMSKNITNINTTLLLSMRLAQAALE